MRCFVPAIFQLDTKEYCRFNRVTRPASSCHLRMGPDALKFPQHDERSSMEEENTSWLSKMDCCDI